MAEQHHTAGALGLGEGDGGVDTVEDALGVGLVLFIRPRHHRRVSAFGLGTGGLFDRLGSGAAFLAAGIDRRFRRFDEPWRQGVHTDVRQ